MEEGVVLVGNAVFLHEPFRRRRRARTRPQPAHRLAARLHDLDAPALQRALRLGRAVAQPLLRPLLAPLRTEEQAALEGGERRRRLAQTEQRPPLVRGRVRGRGRLGLGVG